MGNVQFPNNNISSDENLYPSVNKSKIKNIEQIFNKEIERGEKLFKKLSKMESSTKKIEELKNIIIGLEEKSKDYSNKIENSRKVQLSGNEGKTQPKGKIQKLEKKLIKVEKQLSNLRHKLDKQQNSLVESEKFPAQIFELEYELRKTLDKWSASGINTQNCQQLFNEKMKPLLDKTKAFIKSKPLNASVQGAAKKGKALQAGIRTMADLAKKGALLKNENISAQKIFRFPEEPRETVFKISGRRAYEETQLVDNPAEIMGVEVVPSKTFKGSNLKKLGMSLPKEIQERGYIPTNLSPELKKGIEDKLSPDQKVLFNSKQVNVPNQQEYYVTPNLNDPSDQTAYEICEKFQWKYLDQLGNEQIVDFKTLHAKKLQNEMMNNLEAIPQSGVEEPKQNELDRAFNVPWIMASTQLQEITQSGVTPLQKFEAKPFIQDMILMSKLNNTSRNYILNHMSLQSQRSAIGLAELQPLDLHGENLGVVPIPNQEYDQLKNLKFDVGGNTLNFQELLSKFVEGKIKLDTMIKYQEGNNLYDRKLNDSPELLKALNVEWKIVIFDTDVALAEDNHVHFFYKIGDPEKRHLIPFRSVLLESNWKDTPLSEELIQELTHSDERDLQVKQWIEYEDAPIYQRFSDSLKFSLKTDLAPILENYNLSEKRPSNFHYTVKELRNEFVNDITKVDNKDKKMIWERIEKELSEVSINPNDTWDSLSTKYKQDIDMLKSLNPNLDFKNIQKGMKIKIHIDLTSDSPEAIKERKKIAAQLFPRYSPRQRDALIERQNNRKEYLRNYQILKNSSENGKDLIRQMRGIISQSTTPLTSVQKKEMIDKLENDRNILLNNPSELEQFKKNLLDSMQPTYFNISKSMYPLLADAYALNEILYKKKFGERVGMTIGLPPFSLDESIKLGMAHNDATAVALAQRLQSEIDASQDKAYFDSIYLP